MEQNELNSLAECYRTSRCERVYESVYRAMDGLQSINRRSLAKTRYGDDAEADEIFDKVFDRIINTEVTQDFTKLLSVSLKNARIDFIRKEQRRRTGVVSLEDTVKSKNGDQSNAPTLGSIIQSECDTERDALIKKKRAEQLSLIDSILEPSQDSVTSDIVTLFPRYDSANALAKALGVHHTVVSRKLRALSRNYDERKFGDIHDYLAV
jgi:DNA-directed RNA polymerase specialized sigma24 family protein